MANALINPREENCISLKPEADIKPGPILAMVGNMHSRTHKVSDPNNPWMTTPMAKIIQDQLGDIPLPVVTIKNQTGQFFNMGKVNQFDEDADPKVLHPILGDSETGYILTLPEATAGTPV